MIGNIPSHEPTICETGVFSLERNAWAKTMETLGA